MITTNNTEFKSEDGCEGQIYTVFSRYLMTTVVSVINKLHYYKYRTHHLTATIALESCLCFVRG
jgi:hypothetical protein